MLNTYPFYPKHSLSLNSGETLACPDHPHPSGKIINQAKALLIDLSSNALIVGLLAFYPMNVGNPCLKKKERVTNGID